MQCTITHSSQPTGLAPCRASKAHPWPRASPRVHWPRARQSWQSTLPVPADASSYSMYKMHGQPPLCLDGSLLLSWGGLISMAGRDLPCPALPSSCLSMPSHPIPSHPVHTCTFPPPPLASNQRHQIQRVHTCTVEPRSLPPCCKSPSLSSLQFPASSNPTFRPLSTNAHQNPKIPLNLSESSVRRVATVPPSGQFAHRPPCISDHLVSRLLLLPSSATLCWAGTLGPRLAVSCEQPTRL